MRTVGQAALGVLVAATMVGCTGSHKDPAASFWRSHAAPTAQEADPPASLAELARRSDVVALGRIVKISAGRDYTQPGKPAVHTDNVSINANASTSHGTSFVVELDAGSESTASLRAVSSVQYVFYLQRWYTDVSGHPVFRCTSAPLCVIGSSGTKLIAVRAPGSPLTAGLTGTAQTLFADAAKSI